MNTQYFKLILSFITIIIIILINHLNEKKLHLAKFSFLQIKFTCNLNLMNFNKILNRYKVIICMKMNQNKNKNSTKILSIYHHLIYCKLKLIYTQIEITYIEHMH